MGCARLRRLLRSCCFPIRMRTRSKHASPPLRARTLADAALLECSQLPLGWADLPARQPIITRAVEAGACEAPAAGTLGHNAGSQFHLPAHEPAHQSA